MAKKPKTKAPINYPLASNYIHSYQGKVQNVDVAVHINFATGHITLIDTNPSNPKAVQGKQWIFANRTLECMAGWNDILDAMKSAIADATANLEAYNAKIEEKREKETRELIMNCVM